MTFGTFTDFIKRLKESFKPHNNAADALTQLRALEYKLGENIDEHITKFRMCLARTKLDKTDESQAMIEFFKKPYHHSCYKEYMEERLFQKHFLDGIRKQLFRSKYDETYNEPLGTPPKGIICNTSRGSSTSNHEETLMPWMLTSLQQKNDQS